MKQSLPLLVITTAVLLVGGLLFNSQSPMEYQARQAEKAGLSDGAAQVRHEMLANPETGEIDYAMITDVNQIMSRRSQEAASRSIDIDWISAGPDNVGGRNRSIYTYQDNPNKVLCGGVSGGLFRSNDGAASWERVESFNDISTVSSVTRTGDGTLYVGTGHRYDDFVGNGLYSSSDDGETWSIVEDFTPSTTFSTSQAWATVTVLHHDPNNSSGVWIGYGGGLLYYDHSDGSSDERLNSACTSLSISDDGDVLIASSQNRVWTSTDGGANWTDRSGNDVGEVPSSGVGRLEVAVSPDQPDYMYTLAAATNGALQHMYASTNRGETWYQLYGSSEGGTLPFSPFSNGLTLQGNYDNCITVVPGLPTQAIIGGIRIYSIDIVGENPPSPQWNAMNINFLSQGVPSAAYVHSDIHTFHWDANANLYVGCDGGVFRGTPNGWLSTNYEFRTTQFYGIDFNSSGHIIGGTQDNGTHIINGFGLSNNDSFQALGGDGFDCAFSKFDSDLAFGTIYNNDVLRSFDGGLSGINIVTNDEFAGPFWTVIDLWETVNDDEATEVIEYTASANLSSGETINYASLNYGMPLEYTLTENLAAGESIMLPDPAQSLFCNGGLGSFRFTRDATKNTVAAGEIDWIEVSAGVSGTVTSFEFAHEGDIIYIGTDAGRIYRISGLRGNYTQAELQSQASSSLETIYAGGGIIRDMAVDPNNEDVLMFSKPGYSETAKLFISTEAATVDNDDSFEAIWNMPEGLERMPAYSCSFDINNPGRILVGTEYGVWVSEDGGDSFTECNEEMGRIPVYSIEQQTLSTEDMIPGRAVLNEGTIYVGTYGRGIFYDGGYILSNDDIIDESNDLSEMSIYPNPAVNSTTLALELAKAQPVIVQIADMNGRLVSTLPQGALVAGSHQLELNTEALSSGTYLVTVFAGNSLETTRLNIQK